jgi:Trypsin-like peptidase domain
MKLNRFAGALCVSLIFSAPFAKALTTTEIVQQAKPAVVLIEGLNSQTGKEQLGTGFFVDPVTIVTNDHVMRGTYDKLAVHRLDGTYFTIDYVAFTSQQHDICVLRTKEESSDWLNLSATLPLEGEPIVVIGNPKGLTGTISQGIVSALRENGVMQITAPVTQGSSGSPVLNMDGQVVAIVDRVASHDEANLGFSRDLRVLKIDMTISENNRYGDAFSLAQRPVQQIQQEQSRVDGSKWSDQDLNDGQQVLDLVRRYMDATQNGHPVSLTPFITLTVTDWYDEGKKTIRQAEASIAEYYRAYPVQSTSFDLEKMYVLPLDGKSVNGHSVFEVRVPFTWIAQGNKGAKKSGYSTLQALVTLTKMTDGSSAQWRICAIHNVKSNYTVRN